MWEIYPRNPGVFFYRAAAVDNGSNCLLFKWAVTAFWLTDAERHRVIYVSRLTSGDISWPPSRRPTFLFPDECVWHRLNKITLDPYNMYNAERFLFKPWRTNIFNLKSSSNVLVNWVNIHYKLLILSVREPPKVRGVKGGGPRVVVSTAAFHASEIQYCGVPTWPRGSVLGLRPPGFEFRILCLEDSVISIISPSSGGSPGPV